jgi:hypothetical protein
MALTVWAVYTGTKYSHQYLLNLHAGVVRHLAQPFDFAAITDQAGYVPGRAYQSDPRLPGWWQKLLLFHLTRKQPPEHRNLFIDLDSVITGSLDAIVDGYSKADIAMPRNWAPSGHGGWQSSVILWRGGTNANLYDTNTSADRARLWGDQEWITERLGETVGEIRPGLVASYKYHARNLGRPPEGASVVTFHGDPKPHQAPEAWVQNAWAS